MVQKLHVYGHPREVSTVPNEDRAKWRIVLELTTGGGAASISVRLLRSWAKE
jgi:hypothetical protein